MAYINTNSGLGFISNKQAAEIALAAKRLQDGAKKRQDAAKKSGLFNVNFISAPRPIAKKAGSFLSSPKVLVAGLLGLTLLLSRR